MKSLQEYLAESHLEHQAYARIRKAIGYLGIAIPILCLSLSIHGLCAGKVLPSISHYYYSIVGDAFVAVLFALGLFLLLYKSVFKVKSLRRWENRFTNIAGLFACMVAFIPTNPSGGDCFFIRLTPKEYQDIYGFLGHLHLPAAGLMLLIFGVLSYHFFPRNWETGIANSENKKIYRACAWVIFMSIAILIVFFLLAEDTLASIDHIPIVFIFECTSVVAFAISWLQKGRAGGAIVEMYTNMTKAK